VPPRLALRVHEAAEALGISDELFTAYVRDQLACVRVGTLRLYPIAELERWLAERAERPQEGTDAFP
jgi:excisionase family DNA binding protein